MKEMILPDSVFLEAVREELAQGRSVTVDGTGNSMRPFILPETDRITLSPLPKKLRRGDICMYLRRNGKVVIHRIVSREKDSYVMCGDAQTKREPGVKESQIVAYVSQRIRNGKVTRCDTAGARFRFRFNQFTRPLRRAFWRTAAPIWRKLKAVFSKTK